MVNKTSLNETPQDPSRRTFLLAAAAAGAVISTGRTLAEETTGSRNSGPNQTTATSTVTVEQAPHEIWKSDPRLTAFRKRLLGFDHKRVNTGWLDILIAQGAVLCGIKLNDLPLLNWAKQWADYHAAFPVGGKRDSNIGLLDPGTASKGFYLNSYCGDWGAPFVLAPLHKHSANPRYLEVITATADHIMENSARGQDGVIRHAEGLGVWVDTLYYSAGVLANAFAATGKNEYAEEAVRQCILHAKHLRDPAKGLFYHDLDLKSGVRTNCFWARGNGWIIMALADTLTMTPKETAGYDEVLSIYRSQVNGLLGYQHKTGLWRIVPEDENSHLETSGSIMFLCGLTAGIAAGLIDKAEVDEAVQRGFRELKTWLTSSGKLMGSQHPAGGGDWNTHKLVGTGEDTYTIGVFLRLISQLHGSAVNR